MILVLRALATEPTRWRYGYDLGYDEIGAALGSSEAAARQAASAGVRRLRKEQR